MERSLASFELKIKLTELPDILIAMREWLDHHRSTISHFRSQSDAEGMVVIKVGFNLEDGHSEAFRQRFGPDGLLQSN